jgi:hypothetical protein
VNPIFAAALEMQEFCVARRFGFCFIGGLSVQRWGEPRLTVDVDLTMVHKAFADRAKDWLDIEGIAIRQAGRLDEALICAELRPLLALKGTPEVEERLGAVLRAARRAT